MQSDIQASAMDSSVEHSPWMRFFQPIRHSRAFTLLWLGQWIAVLGSTITLIILPFVVYSITGSSTIMGLAMTTYMLPNVLVLPFSGWIVDRMDRTRLILFTNGSRFLLMLGAAVTVLTGQMNLYILFAGLAVYGLLDGIFNPTFSALRAQVFTPDIRNAANALAQISIQAVRLLGPPLGGFIVSVSSPGVGFALDSLMYLVSFICFWLLAQVLSKRIGTSQEGTLATSATSAPSAPSGASFLHEFLEGIAVLKRIPWLWITILTFSFLNICYTGIITVLIPWLFKIHHGYSPSMYGLAMAGSGAGAIIGAILYGARKEWRHRGIIAYCGALLAGVALLLLAYVSWVPGMIFVMMLEGFGLMMFMIIWEISLQELVPPEAFGRVASLDMLGSFALLPIGYLAVGALADHIGGIAAMQIFASIGMLLIILVLCIPQIRRFD